MPNISSSLRTYGKELSRTCDSLFKKGLTCVNQEIKLTERCGALRTALIGNTLSEPPDLVEPNLCSDV